jgi:hypothetical protein
VLDRAAANGSDVQQSFFISFSLVKRVRAGTFAGTFLYLTLIWPTDLGFIPFAQRSV